MSKRTPETNPTPSEYALVALVMGMIGLVGLPRSPSAPIEAHGQKLRADVEYALGSMREAVEAYRADHHRFPGVVRRGEAPPDLFEAQITTNTTATGALPEVPWDRRARYGPYLLELPANPVSGLSSVWVIAREERAPTRADGTTGWIYNSRTGRVRANTRGELPGTSTRFYDL